MKNFIALVIVCLLIGSCGGCNNDNNGLIGEVIEEDSTIEINLKRSIGKKNVVIKDESGKSISLTTVTSAPITSGTKTLLDVQLGPSIGVYNKYEEMEDVINKIAGVELKYQDGPNVTSRIVYPNPDLFRIFTTFGKIDPTLLEADRPYREKLLKELKDNFNNDYSNYLESDSVTIKQTKLLRDFRDKYTIVHQISYGKELVETNKYWITDKNDKVQTLFDVGAVCPPVCP